MPRSTDRITLPERQQRPARLEFDTLERTMKLEDFLYRGTIDKIEARFSYALTTTLTNEAILSHNCDPMAAHILGRALTAGVLSSPLLEDDERLMIRWNYEGVIGALAVEVGANSDVRGFISPTTLDGLAETESDLFGPTCQVHTLKSSGPAVLNSGVTKSIFQDPVEDLAHAYCISDQVESAMVVMIGFDANPKEPVVLCHGLLLQALPDCDLERFDRIRSRMKEPDLRKLLRHAPEVDNHFETIIKTLTADETCTMSVAECAKPVFRCPCGPERMLAALQTLPPAEKADVLAKGEDLRMTCHFCNKLHVIPLPLIKKAFGKA